LLCKYDEAIFLQSNSSLFAVQDGAAVAAKQSKKGKKDIPVSQFPSEVKLHVYFY